MDAIQVDIEFSGDETAISFELDTPQGIVVKTIVFDGFDIVTIQKYREGVRIKADILDDGEPE